MITIYFRGWISASGLATMVLMRTREQWIAATASEADMFNFFCGLTNYFVPYIVTRDLNHALIFTTARFQTALPQQLGLEDVLNSIRTLINV